MKKAIVLLSGGLDSTTCLYWARSNGYRLFTLLFDYGQKHKRELNSAIRIANSLKVPYQMVRFSLPWGGSSLVDKLTPVPTGRGLKEISSGKIPSSYVPARNTIFLSFALSYADAVGAGSIVIGANAIDYSGYPDCRPQYIMSMQKVAVLGTRSGNAGNKIKILTPLIHLSKSQIIKLGLRLGVPYKKTWSCYLGGRRPCGQCDSCLLRSKGFQEAGAPDPS